MRILHTEASNGWGGQEIRILRESLGMRERGHEIYFVVVSGGQLAKRAKEAGFTVYELPMDRWHIPTSLFQLIKILRKHHIDIINTHSSFDGWFGGCAGKLAGVKVIRTRHLSTAIRPGMNANLLYRLLADCTVTTCEETAEKIRQMTGMSHERCLSIPTGIEIERVKVTPEEIQHVRQKYGISNQECVIGTACVLRSWKGIGDFILAAKLLKNIPNLRWLIVGSGPMDLLFKEEVKKLGIQDKVIFTGFLENPFPAIGAMDIFLLLSTTSEGVSQASLQAAFLKKPQVTTTIGGLPEVCINEETGFTVPPKSPAAVAEKVAILAQNPKLREEMGSKARQLVLDKFTMEKTLNAMERIYHRLLA